MGRLATERRGLGPAATISLVVIAITLVGILAVGVVSWIDPFGSEQVDRSGPAVLDRIRTLEEFNAAEANFTQDVDLENDAKYVPDFIKGERVTAMVTGQVRATVDFSQLDEDAVTVSDDGTTIRLVLPEPQLSDAEVEESSTRIVSRDRGLIDRFEDAFSGNPTDDSKLYQAAEDKLAEAASQSDLLAEARANTSRWLTAFLTAAGFETVEISWVEAPT